MNYSIPQQLIDSANSLAAATIPSLERSILIVNEIANSSVILDDNYNAFADVKNDPNISYSAVSQTIPARIKYLDKADSETELIFNGRGDSKAVSTSLRQDYGIVRIKVEKQYTDLVKNSTKIIVDGFDCQLLFNYTLQTLFDTNYTTFYLSKQQ